jgi:DNA adenine methylase
MKLPHPIPYQGSKRNLAEEILRYFPTHFTTLIEPFAGSAAITIASAYHLKADRFYINDINEPLVELWKEIINIPDGIAKKYEDIWHEQLGKEEKHYYEIREKFNKTQKPEYLLFLLAKCVKAAVRYNAKGEFNQSPDKRRLGRNPELMKNSILRVSRLLKGKTIFSSKNYEKVLENAGDDDLVYMDPPYQGTGLNGGFNYAGNIEFDHFVKALFDLNKRNIPFILSYDGRTGTKTYGIPLPEELGLVKVEIDAGRSSQATLLNRNENTFEALFLSSSLIRKIDLKKTGASKSLIQTELFLA